MLGALWAAGCVACVPGHEFARQNNQGCPRPLQGGPRQQAAQQASRKKRSSPSLLPLNSDCYQQGSAAVGPQCQAERSTPEVSILPAPSALLVPHCPLAWRPNRAIACLMPFHSYWAAQERRTARSCGMCGTTAVSSAATWAGQQGGRACSPEPAAARRSPASPIAAAAVAAAAGRAAPRRRRPRQPCPPAGGSPRKRWAAPPGPSSTPSQRSTPISPPGSSGGTWRTWCVFFIGGATRHALRRRAAAGGAAQVALGALPASAVKWRGHVGHAPAQLTRCVPPRPVQIDILTRMYPCADCAKHFKEIVR